MSDAPRLRILVIGAGGLLGRAVVGERCNVVAAGSKSGEIRVDIADPVGPTLFAKAMGDRGPFFRGFDPVPVARAANAFSRSVEGRRTGQIYQAQ
jgi:hypothetical protein